MDPALIFQVWLDLAVEGIDVGEDISVGDGDAFGFGSGAGGEYDLQHVSAGEIRVWNGCRRVMAERLR